MFLLNTLFGGKSCLVVPVVAVPPRATETVSSPWLVADEGGGRYRTLNDEKKIYNGLVPHASKIFSKSLCLILLILKSKLSSTSCIFPPTSSIFSLLTGDSSKVV